MQDMVLDWFFFYNVYARKSGHALEILLKAMTYSFHGNVRIS